MASFADNTAFTHLAIAAGGVFAGKLWAEAQADEAKRSRAERDYPDDLRDLCEEVAPLLDDWEPDENCEGEDDFTDDLVDYLEANCDWEIEVRRDTPDGCPDILIGDLLALELKINPGKSESDRLVGQCAGYSRRWATWAIVIDAP